MRSRSLLRICLIAALAVPVASSLAQAQSQGNSRMSVTVSFGAGLNTAQQGNVANHHVLPNTIEIKAGGVVNFAVAGFHQIIVYQPGVVAGDIVVPPFMPPPPFPPANLFINYDLANAYYVGLNPDNANPGTPAAPANRYNGENRIESVSFSEPGVYLVICNVNPHFRDGMFAYVKVSN
jgi:plastocyanin